MKHPLHSLGLAACSLLLALIPGRGPALRAEEVVVPNGPAVGIAEPKDGQRHAPPPETDVGGEEELRDSIRRVAGEIREMTKLLSVARRKVESSAEVVAAKQAIIAAEMAYADILDTKLREDPETGALLVKIAELQAKQRDLGGHAGGAARAETLKRQAKRDPARDREKGMKKQVRPAK